MIDYPRPAARSLRRTFWLGLLLAVCVTRLWLMVLPSSLWEDEMGTVFAVEHPHDRSLEVAPHMAASIYYTLPRITVQLAGRSELGYRIPSVLAMVGVLWIVARLAVRLIHPQAGWFAAFACLALKDVDYFAADARPYALGMLIAAASVWFLVSWLDDARGRDAVAFAVCAALLLRVHLVYWPFYLVLMVYAVARLASRKTTVSWQQTAMVFALVGCALIPVAQHALAEQQKAAQHTIVPLNSWRVSPTQLRWNLVLMAALGAGLIWRASRRGVFGNMSDAKLSSVLIFGWCLLPMAGLYIFSVVTGQSVYLVRYFSEALPGASLAAALAASWMLPVRWWDGASVLMALGALLWLGQWTTVWPDHDKANWRDAAAEINRVGSAGDLPVVCISPFVEGRWPAWRPDYRLPGFLYAPLTYYPIRGRVIPLPFEDAAFLTAGRGSLAPTEPRAGIYAAQLLKQTLTERGGFLIYGASSSVYFWQKWFAARSELRLWKTRWDEFGNVAVVHYWGPPATPVSTEAPIGAAFAVQP